MKKQTLILLAGALAALTLSACGGTAATGAAAIDTGHVNYGCSTLPQ